jgi:flagellar assembly protein FliH
MPWSKRVLTKELAEKAVLEFSPPRFDLGTPGQALEYLKEKASGSDFRMNDSVRIQTGVDKIEEANLEEKIEVAALEKLKEIQEAAYKEAYDLGLEEGRNDAFTKVSAEIKERMDTLDQLLTAVTHLKKELEHHNETHLIKLTFQMAARLARHEVQMNNDIVTQVIRDAVALSQDEENVTVRVSPDQFDFLETLKKQTGREFDFMKKIRFEPSPDISAGGCVVETNYGEVDARLEQRIEQLWAALVENAPKVKDKIAG